MNNTILFVALSHIVLFIGLVMIYCDVLSRVRRARRLKRERRRTLLDTRVLGNNILERR